MFISWILACIVSARGAETLGPAHQRAKLRPHHDMKYNLTLDGSFHHQCMLFHVQKTSETTFYYHHCHLSNRFIIKSIQPRHNLFTLRIVSQKHLSTSLFDRVDDHTQTARYHAHTTGVYKAFIRTVMDDPALDLRKNCIRHRVLVNVEFEVDAAHAAQSLPAAREDPACCWEFAKPLDERAMMQYQGWDGQRKWNATLAANLAFSKVNGLVNSTWAKQCVADKHVCILGDSHGRFMFNAMAKLLNASSFCRHGEAECRLPGVTYRLAQYASLIVAGLAEMPKCTHGLVNYGQWPAGWPDEPVWPAERYEAETRGMFESLIHTSAVNKTTITWLDINPFPLIFEGHGTKVSACPPGDWRLPHAIREYNAIASRLARALHVPTLNQHDIMFHLFDASNDGAHYEEPAGDVLAHLAFLRICNGATV